MLPGRPLRQTARLCASAVQAAAAQSRLLLRQVAFSLSQLALSLDLPSSLPPSLPPSLCRRTRTALARRNARDAIVAEEDCKAVREGRQAG